MMAGSASPLLANFSGGSPMNLYATLLSSPAGTSALRKRTVLRSGGSAGGVGAAAGAMAPESAGGGAKRDSTGRPPTAHHLRLAGVVRHPGGGKGSGKKAHPRAWTAPRRARCRGRRGRRRRARRHRRRRRREGCRRRRGGGRRRRRASHGWRRRRTRGGSRRPHLKGGTAVSGRLSSIFRRANSGADVTGAQKLGREPVAKDDVLEVMRQLEQQNAGDYAQAEQFLAAAAAKDGVKGAIHGDSPSQYLEMR